MAKNHPVSFLGIYVRTCMLGAGHASPDMLHVWWSMVHWWGPCTHWLQQNTMSTQQMHTAARASNHHL